MSRTLAELLPELTLPAGLAGHRVGPLRLDSRQVMPGDTFIALPGQQQDGRIFIPAAIGQGAALVLQEHAPADVEATGSVPVLSVPNLRQRLGSLASAWWGHPSLAMTVTGVTGTNGKTSVSGFLAEAWNRLGQSAGLIGTLGLRCGDQSVDLGHTTPDPLTLQAGLARCRDAGVRQLVMEVSSHALDQGRLNGTRVHTAVFTNLSRDHLDYHGHMDAYLQAKLRLFQWPELVCAVIPLDDPLAARLLAAPAAAVTRVTYGRSAQADVQCRAFHPHADGFDCTLQVGGAPLSLSVPLYGRFNLNNLMAAVAALLGQGVSVSAMATALSALTPVPGRMQPVPRQRGPRVLVDYAHTPDGLEKALEAVRSHFSGTLTCVFGCGGDRDRGKRPQMAAVAERLADRLVLTSDNPRSEAPESILDDMTQGLTRPDAARRIVDRAEAIRVAVAEAGETDLVLIAGKGHETWQEVAGRRLPLDDRDLAARALQQWGGRCP